MTAAAISRLNADHRRALNAFARSHGRTWRSKLLALRAKGGYGIEGDLVHAVNLVGPSGIRAYKVGATPNPASACLPSRRPSGKSRGYNVHEGDVFHYRGARYKVIGCGIGPVAHKHAGAQVEGTYAVMNLSSESVRYLAKRTVRDAIYQKGTEGRPKPRGPRTAAKRKSARAKTGRKANGQFARKGR
jgi:hypothetical protein